jgi:predicted metal-binding membrane protein
LLVRDRWLIGGCLALLVAFAWAYLLVLSAQMNMAPSAPSMAAMPDMPGMPGMAAAATEPITTTSSWSVKTFALTAVMWWVMMIGMMLPSAVPIVLLFGGVQRRQLAAESPALRVAVFTLGYLVVWGAFSLLAATAQWGLTALALLAPMDLTATSAWLGALLVALAGAYQLTPLKNVCLRHCRAPAEYLSSHWRRGTAGAFRMGIGHGAYCVGCCWLLMALLFVVGVMNLLWVAAIAVFVLLEKLVPRGELVARASGVALLGFALYLGLNG